MKALLLIAGIANLLALADMPYGYYEALRWVNSVSALGLAILCNSEGKRGWLALAIPVLALWNPFFGATMAKSSWAIFNLAAAIGFISASRNQRLLQS